MEENKFDFKFLNKVMYIFTFIVIILGLRELGILSKIYEIIITLAPLYAGIIICWVSKPIANRLRKMGLSRGLSTTIALFIIFGIILLALAYIIPIIGSQLTQLIIDLPSLYSSAIDKVNDVIENKLGYSYQISSDFDINFVLTYMDDILDYSLNTVQSVANFVISFITAIMISFFMVKDVDRTKNNLIVFLAKNAKDSNTYKMLVEMDEIINSYVRGLIIDSVIVGIMITVLCMVLKLKYAVIFGIMICLLNFIPYIGAAVSYIITSLYAFTVGGPVLAVITFVASFIVQLIDANILQPNIIAKSVKLHPVVVICGLLVFNKVFGILGMVIAMPVLAIGKVYLKYKFNIGFDTIEEDDKKLKRKVKTKKEIEKQVEDK